MRGETLMFAAEVKHYTFKSPTKSGIDHSTPSQTPSIIRHFAEFPD
jgi:hypothetical protein